jgi:hypothetical protein
MMLSSTVCLYAGTEDSLRNRYPRKIVVDTYSVDPQYVKSLDATIGLWRKTEHKKKTRCTTAIWIWPAF